MTSFSEMKLLLIIALVIGWAGRSNGTDLPGPDGSTWHDVSLTSWDVESITISHDGGIRSRIALKDLPANLQEEVLVQQSKSSGDETGSWVSTIVNAPAREILHPLATTSVTVKQVLAKDWLGNRSPKFYYIFTVTNKGDSEFYGSFNLTLLNKMEGITNGSQDFVARLAPGVTKTIGMEAFTGPERVHAFASVANYVLTVGEGTGAQRSKGTITTRFEDLSGSVQP